MYTTPIFCNPQSPNSQQATSWNAHEEKLKSFLLNIRTLFAIFLSSVNVTCYVIWGTIHDTYTHLSSLFYCSTLATHEDICT